MEPLVWLPVSGEALTVFAMEVMIAFDTCFVDAVDAADWAKVLEYALAISSLEVVVPFAT